VPAGAPAVHNICLLGVRSQEWHELPGTLHISKKDNNDKFGVKKLNSVCLVWWAGDIVTIFWISRARFQQAERRRLLRKYGLNCDRTQVSNFADPARATFLGPAFFYCFTKP
jgi:hypothetical protein